MQMQNLEQLAALVRKWCLIATTQAGSGHPTTCLSAADLMTVLFEKFFSYDLKNPLSLYNDRLVFSKGHAAPLLYVLYALSGAFPLEDLKNLRKFGSPLEGHPTPNFPYAEVATGSLGQGLSIAAGMALSAKKDGLPFKTYCLLGDGELAEGGIWEAANFASYYKLDNLIAIADINRLGQSQQTMFGHNITEYSNRFSAFDWEVILIDGHNLEEIENAYKFAIKNSGGKPFVIVAKTMKGKGISFLEDKDGWHGKTIKKEDLEKALQELGEIDEKLRFHLRLPRKAEVAHKNFRVPQLSHEGSQGVYQGFGARQDANSKNFAGSPLLSQHKKGEMVATRDVYGKVLAEIGKYDQTIYALDGDVKNSTYSQDFQKVYPDRFIECFIAEQNMVGVALGLSRLGKNPFVSTFSAFFTRAFDQIRMSVLSKANIKFVGSHAGVSIGEDGSSQMGLEDMAMFGVLPETVVLHPSDAVATAKLLPVMVKYKGIVYLRTLRPKTPVLYDDSESFVIGGSKILRQSKEDLLTVVATGITVHEALKAYEMLKEEGIMIRVLDCYCVKPIDKQALRQSLTKTKKQIIISVEDHFSHGGLGDFILEAVSNSQALVVKMAVEKLARSGTMDELLDYVGISASHIVQKVKSTA